MSCLEHPPKPPEVVQLHAGTYADMKRQLLAWAVRHHGSIRRAAVALGVPRSTLGAWITRLRERP